MTMIDFGTAPDELSHALTRVEALLRSRFKVSMTLPLPEGKLLYGRRDDCWGLFVQTNGNWYDAAEAPLKQRTAAAKALPELIQGLKSLQEAIMHEMLEAAELANKMANNLEEEIRHV